MKLTPNRRLTLVALVTLLLDQASKLAVLKLLGYADERVVIPGFFRFVHWGNTGAAWSMFHGNNELLAVVSLVAVMVLFLVRRHFEFHRVAGQFALGLMFGGIIGNLIDRFQHGHVVDFLRFYLIQRGGDEVGFPAFNIADSAICIGVSLLFILSWKSEPTQPIPATETPQ